MQACSDCGRVYFYPSRSDEVFKSHIQLKLCRRPPEAQAFLELLDTNFFITRLASIVLCAKKARFPAQKKKAHRTQLTGKKRPLLRFIAAPLIGGQPKKEHFSHYHNTIECYFEQHPTNTQRSIFFSFEKILKEAFI